jgi:CRISPR-associated protein Cas5t
LITLRVEAPYASFRKSYARSFAETYPFPPPSTIYGMLLSLVGERFRQRHEGVKLAFGFKRVPHIAITLKKLSRFKYGVGSKSGTKPDFVQTLCGIEFLCWVDSSLEKTNEDGTPKEDGRSLEDRIIEAIQSPSSVDRYGVLCLGLSDDAVNDVSIYHSTDEEWFRLLPSTTGNIELPVWVDHVGAAHTRWRRYQLSTAPTTAITPDESEWTEIIDPRNNKHS